MQTGAAAALDAAEGLVKSGEMNVNDCHIMGHAVGHASWRKERDLGRAFRACTQKCIQGCYHGAVEAFMIDGPAGQDLARAGARVLRPARRQLARSPAMPARPGPWHHAPVPQGPRRGGATPARRSAAGARPTCASAGCGCSGRISASTRAPRPTRKAAVTMCDGVQRRAAAGMRARRRRRRDVRHRAQPSEERGDLRAAAGGAAARLPARRGLRSRPDQGRPGPRAQPLS